MATDDLIQVRLQVDEESVAQVRSRVQNVVKSLNTKPINLAFTVSGLQKAEQSIERISNRLNEIRDTQINVNSNALLTTEQQQYRLETQRLAVLQRIELAKERTAQSENNAIAALAQENRTLTANLNLNQRINGEVEHTHTRMRDMNNQQGRFLNSLQRSLVAFASYRIINTITRSITSAYEELKKVDTEMVNIQKVTGFSADEMDRLEKSSYRVAQNYGRSASEFLSGTAAFAKAGYKNKSSELGELSLLAENVGDIDNALASQFLISSDAAWKLNGDVKALTSILDGFNELSNQTATTVGDLAEGMTVSASMFAQAGLSAQDYSAMVGTAQAKTQESGKVVARGLRTVLMNLRQIKGTDIETGEIIDETKLAKAESTLKSIGIDIRETANGVSELRNPMVILDELAAKWENLTSVQQSAVQEALANKRQSNVFTALIEGWDDVEKATQIYAESSGSAMRENEIYLNSWAAKLEILQANWTGFIANLTDTDIIKNGLDAVSDVIKVLDTDVGRFIVQIGLLAGAMALLNRGFTWIQGLQAFQRLNLSAEILRITASTYGLGAATQLLTTTLWEMVKAWAATPMGMITIAVGGIMLITKAVDALTVSQEEAIEAANEAIDKINETRDALNNTKQTIDDISSDYEKLSQGVDNLGRNVSLNSEQYARYNEIVNQIADMFPEMIRGYTEEGNAIIAHKGNVEELTKAYEAQKQAYQDMIITTSKDVFSGYKAKVVGGDNATDTYMRQKKALDDAMEAMSQGREALKDFIDRSFTSDSRGLDNERLKTALQAAGIDVNGVYANGDKLYDVLVAQQGKVEAYYRQLVTNINAETAKVKPIISAFMEQSDDYKSLDTEAQDIVKEIVNQFDYSFYTMFDNEMDMTSWITQNIVDKLKGADGKQISEAFGSALDLKTQFQNGEITIDEYLSKVQQIKQLFSGFDDKVQTTVELIFDMPSSDGVSTQNLIDNVKNKLQDDFKNKVGELKLEDLKLAANLEVPEGALLSWDELLEKIQAAKAEAFKMTDIADVTSAVSNAISVFSSAQNEMTENGMLSLDTVTKLREEYPELADKIIATADGYKLESGSIQELTDALMSKYRLELDNAMSAAETVLKSCGVQVEGYSAVTGAIYDQIKAQADLYAAMMAIKNAPGLAGYEFADNAMIGGMPLSQLEASADFIERYNAIEKRKKDLDALQAALNDGIFSKSAQSAKEAAKKIQDANDKIADLNEQLDELAENEALEALKKKFDDIDHAVEKVSTTMSLLDTTLGLTAEDDYIAKIMTTSRQLDLARQKAALLTDEFEQLRAEEYTNADSANELASRMKSVADNIAENNKAMLEYGKNITEYYTSAITSVSSLSKATLDEASDLIDRNVKSLSEGGLMGMTFDVSPTVPLSAVEQQRRQNQTLEEQMQAYYKDVEAMQKAALDLQYQETVADNERKRQELYKSIAEQEQAIAEYSSNVQAKQKSTNAATSAEQERDHTEKQAETQNFSNTEETIVVNLNEWMKGHPILAPSLDKTGWEQRVSEVEVYAKRIQDAVNGSLAAPWSSSLVNKTANALNGSDTGTKAVNLAQQFLGTPYVWGGASPSGFDCSGLVQYVYKQLGYNLDRVTYEQVKQGRAVAKADLQAGDLVFFNTEGTNSHVGLYIGNGQFIHAPHTGDVVKISDINSDYYASHYSTARRITAYAKGTQDFGIAGENHKLEWAIDKKTGEWSPIDSPTLFNKDEYDIVSEKVSAKIDKPIKTYARGTISVPSGLGKYYTYMNWDTITNMDTEQGRLIQSAGKNYDSAGYGKVGNRYALAMTSTFGNIGDYVDVYMADGSVIHGILADEKSQVVTPWDNNPANMWGHDNGQSMVEFVTNWGKHENPAGNGGVLRVDNLGSYFTNPEFASSGDTSVLDDIAFNTAATAESAAVIVRQDIGARIKDIIEGTASADTKAREDIEDEIIEFVAANMQSGEDSTQTLIERFDALTKVDTENREYLDTLKQKLLDSVGTPEYGAVRSELSSEAQRLTNETLKAQVDYEVAAIKESFDRAKQARDLAYEYYNDLLADENVTADQIKAAQQAISEINSQLQECSDKYVSVMSTYAEVLLDTMERELKAYDDRLSWIEKANSEYEKQAENAATATEKQEIWNKQIANYTQEQAVLEEKKSSAHSIAEDIRHNPEYRDIFDKYDTYAWFDAEGNATAQFEYDRLSMSGDPETVTMLNQVFPILQKCTQEWLAADEASKNIPDNIEDINNKSANTKIDLYTGNLERLNEIDEVRKGKQDAITAAMEKQHSLVQSLREETANITAELASSQHTEAYLDEDTRKLIFNDEDFEAEQKAINDIQAKATAAYEKYRKQVSELDETEWFKEQQLTDEYNKRMDILSEQLETEKQRIALKKKELEYDNALKERDTRIILGGRAVQVANPDTMYNLAKERSLAESDLVNTLTTNRETEQERQSDRISQSISQEISMREKMVELIGNMTEAEKGLFAATLPVIGELEMFAAMLSPENIPWLNEHSRDYRGQFVDMDELYKHAGYDMSYDYAGAYDVAEQLYRAGILTDDQYNAVTGQLENQHNWKRSTDINTSMYPYTSRYGSIRYGTESYGINDEAALADSAARDTAREYSRLITELNSGRGTQETLNRLKELNDTTATDNKYILNLLDTTQYAVNEDGVVIRRDSIDQMGEIAHGVIRTLDMQNGDIARGDLRYVPAGEIAHGNFANAYASGTTSAKRGLALTDEEGLEMKLRKFGGQYRMLEGGERIFTAEQTDKLLEFSRAPENFVRDSLLNNMQKSNSQAINNMIANDNRSEVHNHYDFGGVVVEHPVDADDLVSSLVRQANSRWGVTKNMKNI